MMSFVRSSQEDHIDHLNETALQAVIDLYNNKKVFDDQPTSGWAFAINERECVELRNEITHRYEKVKTFDNDNIKDFFKDIDNARNVVIAEDSRLRFEAGEEPHIRKYQIDLPRLRRGLKDCGLNDNDIAKLSLRYLILIESCIATIQSQLVTKVLLEEFNKANALFLKAQNPRGEATDELNQANEQVTRAMQNLQNGNTSYLLHVGKQFIPTILNTNVLNPLAINPPGIVITKFQIDQQSSIHEGFHSEGLPYQIAVDMPKGNNWEVANFINNQVTPLIDRFAEALSLSDNPKQIIADFHNKISELKKNARIQDDFSISIKVAYQKDNQLMSAGLRFETNSKFIPDGNSFNKVIKEGNRLPHYIHNKDDDMLSYRQTMIVPSSDVQKAQQEKVYNQEQNSLSVLIEHKKNIGIKECGTHLKENANQLKAEVTKTQPSKNLTELTRHLSSANRAAKNPNDENLNDLHDRAQKAQGNPSPFLRAVGVGMMALGAGLAVLGALVVAASVIGTAACPLSAVGVLPGVGMMIGGASLFAAGAGMFYHHRQKGMSKDMDEMADELSTHKGNRIA